MRREEFYGSSCFGKMEKNALNLYELTVGPVETNCYILWREGRTDALVIDPGDEGEAIVSSLRDRGLSAGAVLLTHGHFDHTGGLSAFLGVPVYLHQADLPMLESPELSAAFLTGDTRPRPTDALPVSDGEVLSLCGFSVQVLSTPGHTKGSVCYLVDGEVLFSGDTLFQAGYGRTDLPGGSFSELRQSLRKLLSMEKDVPVYPGHGGATTLFRERRLLWNC